MGIFKFLSYLNTHQHDVMEKVDLFEKAKQLNGIELFIDFHNFQQEIYFQFLHSARKKFGNDNFRIGSGEYSLVYEWYKKFAVDMKQRRISLVFFVDGCRGNRVKDFQYMLPCYKSRQDKEINKLQEYLRFCMTGNSSHLDPISCYETRPVLVTMQILRALKDGGAEIIQFATERHDYCVAKEFHRRPKAFAIVTNDSEFACLKGMVFVPSFAFDLENDLIGQPGVMLPKTPEKLIVGLISNQSVMRLLNFQNYDQLIDFCNIIGNDFTQEINRDQRLWSSLHAVHSKHFAEDISEYIRNCRNGSVHNDRKYQEFMRRNTDVAEAHAYGRKFYSLNLPNVVPDDDCPLFRHIIDGVHRGSFGHSLVGMHLRCYWQRNLVEDINQPSSDGLLLELRAQIYALILPRGPQCDFHFNRSSHRGSPYVVEYARSLRDINLVDEIMVAPTADVLRKYPTADTIDRNNLNQNLDFFHSIMTHKEPRTGLDINYISLYGVKQGAMCLCLRYLLRQNEPLPGMRLTMPELATITAAVFWGLDRDRTPEEVAFYCGLKNVPTSRCCTLWNWLQNIYYHMHRILAPLLYLDGLLPQPREVFYSVVFFAFFQVGMKPAGSYHATIASDQLDIIERDRSDSIENCKKLIGHIVEGLNFE